MAAPRIEVLPDLDALSLAAANQFASLAQQTHTTHQPFTVALNGGGTPERLFTLLGQPPFQAQVDWSRVHIFWGDERCVPPDTPGSNYQQAWSAWLQHVPIPAENIHRVQGELEPVAAAADYAQQLASFAHPFPRFDLVLLGMGEDGHTASLFPGPISTAEQTQTVIPVVATYEDRPAQRISLTPLVFNQAQHVWVMATGAKKARTVAAAIHGPRQPEQLPIQRIRPASGEIVWWLDVAAAADLQ